jgi:hypothetical protein
MNLVVQYCEQDPYGYYTIIIKPEINNVRVSVVKNNLCNLQYYNSPVHKWD